MTEKDLKFLRELMAMLSEFNIAELRLEKAGERIVIRRSFGASQDLASLPASPPVHPSVSPSPPAVQDEADIVVVTSPFVGTFYRAPAPGAPPFVEVGSEVRPGQVLCIIEAMKLMNEIESEVSGTVMEILVENGKPVEYGQPLFRIRKSS
ncbi:MAG: acetyl-CoA carboxylase biotin carboxyl carrier protein [Deltaproteobacteria bacterium]|nr:acetyl-CoA carboxylase biotin carboxyl carrier protein [Deltaproteobacteria bacterium]